MFGRKDPETGVDCYEDIFMYAFSTEMCVASWEAVGTVPPTCACLKYSKVHRELGDSDSNDKTQIAMLEMQMANRMVCDLLTAKVFRAIF